MVTTPVYLDNHATTRVDPRVVAAMLPYFDVCYGNAGSSSHSFGWEAKAAVDRARRDIAAAIQATDREIVFTSGATESNNLAIRGVVERARRRGHHLISVATEHKAVLDPLRKLGRRGFELTLLPVASWREACPGAIDLQQVADAIRPDTVLVSVMLANNEIGVIQPLRELAALCRPHGILLHTDATQAVGKLPVDVEDLQIDLLSFTAHKLYGPKGVGALYVRRRPHVVRLEPQIEGGGQEAGLRSGTLNVPGIVGFARAVSLAVAELDTERDRLQALRDRLWQGLCDAVDGVQLNGPPLADASRRLPGNLNCSFANVDGEALMMSMREIAVSSGSACTSTNPEPSHVLRALGIGDDLTRASLRFGVGRFNTAAEIEFAIELLADTVGKLRRLA